MRKPCTVIGGLEKRSDISVDDVRIMHHVTIGSTKLAQNMGVA